MLEPKTEQAHHSFSRICPKKAAVAKPISIRITALSLLQNNSQDALTHYSNLPLPNNSHVLTTLFVFSICFVLFLFARLGNSYFQLSWARTMRRGKRLAEVSSLSWSVSGSSCSFPGKQKTVDPKPNYLIQYIGQCGRMDLFNRL